MRRYLIVPVLLTAAVGPYLAGDQDGAPKITANLTAFANQIQNWNSSSEQTKSSSSESSGTTFGANSAWSSSNANSSGSSPSTSTESSLAGSASTTAGDSFSSSRPSIVVQPISGGKASTSSQNASHKDSSSSGGNRSSPDDGGKDDDSGPVYDFHEILRFDVTPRWVISHWPRVTTVLAELELEGLRVPLVTGTKSDDLAGSLTYYFDKQHVVQRLTFQGFTGDDRRLVKFVGQAYGLKKIPTLGAGLYMIQWNSDPRSALRLTHMPVVRSNTPNMRQEVMLEINRPRSYYGMSEEFKTILKGDRENGRW